MSNDENILKGIMRQRLGSEWVDYLSCPPREVSEAVAGAIENQVMTYTLFLAQGAMGVGIEEPNEILWSIVTLGVIIGYKLAYDKYMGERLVSNGMSSGLGLCEDDREWFRELLKGRTDV